MIQVDLTLPTVPITSFSPQTFTTGYYFEIFIGIMVIVGIVRGLVGRRYSAGRVLRTPAIYILFTAFAIYFTKWPNIYAEAVIVLIPIGIPFGIKFGKDVKIFKKENVLYYRRSVLETSCIVVHNIVRSVCHLSPICSRNLRLISGVQIFTHP